MTENFKKSVRWWEDTQFGKMRKQSQGQIKANQTLVPARYDKKQKTLKNDPKTTLDDESNESEQNIPTSQSASEFQFAMPSRPPLRSMSLQGKKEIETRARASENAGIPDCFVALMDIKQSPSTVRVPSVNQTQVMVIKNKVKALGS
jgi:hypothetical protein